MAAKSGVSEFFSYHPNPGIHTNSVKRQFTGIALNLSLSFKTVSRLHLPTSQVTTTYTSSFIPCGNVALWQS